MIAFTVRAMTRSSKKVRRNRLNRHTRMEEIYVQAFGDLIIL